MADMNWSTLPLNGELNNLTGLATYANTISDGWFWSLIIIGVFLIAYIALSRYTTVRALMASSFITFVLSIFLFFAGLIGEVLFFGLFGLLILAIIASFFFD